MTVPSHAGSMIQNYFDAYRQKYHKHSKLSNEQVWRVLNTVYNDADTQQEMLDRLEAMKDLEEGKQL